MNTNKPDLSLERKFIESTFAGPKNVLIAGIDEVGRGALAGPVSVGCVLISPFEVEEIPGVKDSKLLSEDARQNLIDPIKQWAHGWGVGHSSPEEIDRWGIIIALRLAGHRALRVAIGDEDLPFHVFLDGIHDWMTPSPDLFSFEYDHEFVHDCPPITTIVKGDLRSLTIAAASIMAKVERDRVLTELSEAHPEYGWAQNKGYGSAAHREAIRCFGPSLRHRQTWLTKLTQE